jgi:hypothetical protein
MNDKLLDKFLTYFEVLHHCQKFFLNSLGLNPYFDKSDYSEKEFTEINSEYRKFLDDHGGIYGTLNYITTEVTK